MHLIIWLLKNNISKKNFAKMLGCSRTHLQRIISGDRIPSKKLIEKMTEKTKGEISSLSQIRKKSFK